MAKKLEGLFVVDFTIAMAGPFATQCLADNGARVIKIEQPDGDMLRTAYPIGKTEPSYYYVGGNRSKESVCLNLKDPVDLAFAKKIISKADVLVENFRPGVMDRLGLSYEIVQKLNPRIIYASVSGFGQTGPNKHRACFDLVAQAYSGLMMTNGDSKFGPIRVGFSIADISTAMWAYMAIMTALFAREQTGKGDYIDIAMVDCLFAMQVAPVVAFTALGKEPDRDGNRSKVAAPFGSLPTQDGHLVVAVVGEKLWRTFCNAIGLTHLADDSRFASPSLRSENRDEMRAILWPLFKQKSTREWLEILEKAGVPAGSINTMSDICNSEQIKQRHMLVDVGGIKVAGNPMKFAEQPDQLSYPPVASIGQNTEAVKKEFGN